MNAINDNATELTTEEYFDALIEHEIATYNELCLVTNINGYTSEQLDNVLYAKIGYRSWSQYLECEGLE